MQTRIRAALASRPLKKTDVKPGCSGLAASPPERTYSSNGLARLAGTWTEEEHQRFMEAVAVTEQIDEELWR